MFLQDNRFTENLKSKLLNDRGIAQSTTLIISIHRKNIR